MSRSFWNFLVDDDPLAENVTLWDPRMVNRSLIKLSRLNGVRDVFRITSETFDGTIQVCSVNKDTITCAGFCNGNIVDVTVYLKNRIQFDFPFQALWTLKFTYPSSKIYIFYAVQRRRKSKISLL